MKIGIDLHGVLTNRIEIFKPLLILMRHSGIYIYILSGPPHDEIKEKLADLGYIENDHYDKILSVTDYLQSENVEMWQDHKNTWWSSDEDWWSAKGKMATKYRIDLLIDDSIEYKQYLDENTMFMLLANDVRPIFQPMHEKYLTDEKEVNNYKKAHKAKEISWQEIKKH